MIEAEHIPPLFLCDSEIDRHTALHLFSTMGRSIPTEFQFNSNYILQIDYSLREISLIKFGDN
jgi:hypothetical protein